MPQTNGLSGYAIARDIPYREPDALFALSGEDGMGKQTSLPVGAGLLDRHMLLLGDVGAGKSNMMLHLAQNLRGALGAEDTLMIFDGTGELHHALYQRGDVVLAADKRAAGTEARDCWNLFSELPDDARRLEDASALCHALFAERIAQAVQPFYPMAARDLMLALVVYLKRRGDASLCNNQALRGLIDGFDRDSMIQIAESIPELRAFAAYLRESPDGHENAVAAQLQQAAREWLCGQFAGAGTLGVRSLVRQGGHTVFLCHDASRGMASVFAAMLDTCFTEVLSRVERGGSVYVLVDDLGLLPPLPRMESALLAGRSRGLRVVMSATGVEALDRYGLAAPAMLSAIGTTVAFRLHSRASREYVRGLYGSHRAVESYRSNTQHGVVEQVVDAQVIPDEALTTLQTGECLIATMHYPPFQFRLHPYGAETNP